MKYAQVRALFFLPDGRVEGRAGGGRRSAVSLYSSRDPSAWGAGRGGRTGGGGHGDAERGARFRLRRTTGRGRYAMSRIPGDADHGALRTLRGTFGRESGRRGGACFTF